MEKIVTKIGDVIIERRVSKPQQTKETSVGTNLQQQNVPQIQIIPKTDDQARPLPQYNLTNESFLTSKNVPRPAPMSVSQGTTTQGGIFDLKTTTNQYEFTKVDPAKSQELAQKDITFQNAPNVGREVEESGISLPKVPSFDGAQMSKSGPDLSRLVGISIERKKRVTPESQNQPDFLKPLTVDIKKIPFPHPEIKQEVIDEEEIDDSFEEEEYEEEPVTLEDDVEIAEDSRKSTGIGEQESTIEPEIALIEDEEEEEITSKEELQEEHREEMEIKQERDIKEEIEEEKESDINDLACTDLVELMQKGEIEGEIEDVKDEEMMTDSENKKDNKRKSNEDEETEKDGEEKQEENEDGVPAKKRKKKKSEKGENESENKEDEENDDDDDDDEDEDEDEEGKDKNIDKSKVTNANLRKNIREVMDETQLDEATLAAQRQEAERLKRLQEQQRIIREVQRQIALNRQNQKSQNKVLSLLQGNSQTSILKTSSSASQSQGSQAKSANSVLVKLSNGEQTSLNNRRMMELLKNSKNKTLMGKPPIAKTLLKQGMVTPSVSIAPVIKKEPVEDEKKKKKGDVVTLSSDSEDDCIVLSDEDESEPEEDPTNSGMHTNDKYNLPDEKGRIVVNVGHPETETDLYLAPQIARVIKPHQIGGIRFLYDNVIESIERYQNSAGFGCILAHSMGLGKTLQIVSFSDIFLRYTPAKTILCIMPINTIQNWLAEFNMWLPKESAAEDVRCRDFDLFIVNESLKNINARAKVILDWHKSGGVLLMGYELFRLLSLKKSYKSKKKKKDPEEEDAKQKELIEEVYSALVVPGPDLVICDEGHRIKNSHATTSQALKQIKTKRRIVLTGYPLQNNLLEYWCMVDFVRPNYLGTKTEFSNMFERPIQNGQCIDSTPQDKRLMRYRAHVLHSLLEGFVQRRSHAVLQSALPEKEEYVLLLRFTPFQRKLYDTFMNEVVRTVAVPNPLKAFAVCCKIWNHPDVLYNFLKKKGEEIDLDLEEALPPSLQIPQYPYGQTIGSDGMNQLPMSGTTPWPKRGPGSRGGKVRQPTPRKVGRGRKPAATIPPNVMGEKVPHESEGISPGQYPSSENFPNHHDRMDNFQGRPYSQNQFGGYNNDYSGQSAGYHNPGYSKNPLNNLEDMSGSNYHSKRYFSQQNDSGSQNQYGNQNFDSGHSEANFNPNNSNDSNPLNSSFESNLNSSDSNYNQNESGKPFDYSQDYSSDFYGNSNFPNPNSNYPPDNKNTGFQNNYFQTSGFRNPENFDYQSSSSNMSTGFPSYERSQNFQSSGAGQTFQGNAASNFQNANNNQNLGGQTSGFPNSGNTQSVSRSQTPSFQNSTPTFPTNSGPNFQNTHGNQRVAGGQTSNYQNTTQGNNFQDSNSNSNSSFQTSYQNSETNCSSGNFMGQNPGPNFQGQNSGSNFQDRNTETNFPGQNSGSNFQSRNPESSFQSQNSGLNFQGRNPESNFQAQNSGSTFQGRNPESNFPGQNSGSTFQGRNPESNFQSQNSGSNFPSRNPESNFQGQNSETNYQGQNSGSNFQAPSSGSNFQGQNSGSNFQGQNSGTNFQSQNSGTNFQGNNPNFDRSGSFQGSNYEQGFWPQSNWGYPEASKGSNEFQSNNTTNDYMQQKFNSFETGQESKSEEKVQCNSDTMYNKSDCDYPSFGKSESETKYPEFDEEKVNKSKEEEDEKKEDIKNATEIVKKEESLPYEWAVDLFKTYVTGIIENSSKMEVFFHIVTESIKLGDRLLVFSQSLLTLDLIEDYLHRQNVPDKEEVWAKNRNYFRLDGSTPGLEREKLINEFNGNPNIYLFLVSTRAGSLGINLVGANRVVVFDASWNPCHDTQAVCRVYRYGQRKPCFVYRLVMDSCLEKKIYDRQVNKQGMADRVVDELNPDAHLSIKEVTNLCWDDQEDTTVKDFSHLKDKYNDEIIKVLLDRCSKVLSKEPFQHESLLIDRKEKKLSQAEKRLAKRSYELEKQAANQPKNIYSFFPNTGQRTFAKPIASVRPMQSEIGSRGINSQLQNRSKWIPAEVWQKQGMSAQEMTLPLDVVIPTSSPEKTSIVLKAGQRVMVLKSPKGIYMQLENGKIIAIRSAFKVGQNGPGGSNKSDDTKKEGGTTITPSGKTGNLGVSAKITPTARPGLIKSQQQPFLKPFSKMPDKKPPVNMALARSRQVMGKAKPFMLNKKFENTTPDLKQKLVTGKPNFANQDEKSNSGEQTAVEQPGKDENPPPSEKNEPITEKIPFSNDKVMETIEEKTEEKQEEKQEVTDSLETLRKVTESISDPTKGEKNLNILESGEGEPKYPQTNSLKNYRHNFASQVKPNVPVVEEKKKEEHVEQKPEGNTTSQQQGNENVQNWLMNQSYPPMDPYGNYFPGYYAYGPGPGPMMPPYDGFYPPSNYGHPMGRNSPIIPPHGKQQQVENVKGNVPQPQPPISQNIQNSSTTRNPPAVNTPPIYPPYPNPYPYPYNYPANPSFNNQGFPYPNQNQSTQQTPTINPPTASSTTSVQNQPAPYDNSMYSAFHRPDAPFQTPDNSYPSPYPRPPYPSSGTPGFFPYNHPYPNYPYGPNFNPYMHPAGYGYPMQNPPPVNSQALGSTAEGTVGSNNNSGNS